MVYGDILIAMEKTTVYLPSHLQRALKEAARSENRAQAEVLRKALEEYLERRGRPRLRSIGIGEDAELSGAESEDWLRDEWGKS
jgi:Arc/MetJ-type ribon-helix-helix transcriptional regulator